MAITRAQQARQMLKKGTKPVEQAGVMNYMPSEMVTVPKVAKSSPTHPTAKLAYITDAEKKLLIKKNLHGSLKGKPNRGPGGLPSLEGDFGGPGGFGGFQGGGDYSSAETGNASGFDGTGSGPELPPGVTPKGSKEAQDIRSSFIAAGGGQRVNRGFFDSRNTVSPTELARAKAFAPGAFAKSRGSGFMNFLTGGGITGAIIRGLGQKFGFGKKFNQPTYDMSKLSNLPFGGSASFENLDIRDKFNRTPDDEEENEKLLGSFLSETTTNPMDIREQNRLGNLAVNELFMSKPAVTFDAPKITDTPFQTDLKEENILENAMLASAPEIDYRIGLSNKTTKSILDSGFNIDGTEMTPQEQLEYEKQKKEMENTSGIPTEFAADGGLMGGGIMDAAGRQGYFFGKLVKKITKPLKKIIKSPVGKLGLGALLLGTGGGGAGFSGLGKLIMKNKALAAAAGLTAAPFLFGKDTNDEDYEQFLSQQGSYGKGIDIAGIRNNPYDYLARSFRAEGGSMKEPVAKKTMPLLSMGGMEKDYRADGGFVPIGRMEKADDVPARLSKNEFVFTADAVRNAGDGDIDKGAEVMYNMMKNLEAGGEVSKESQGREGARKMFQTSQRLEEVL